MSETTRIRIQPAAGGREAAGWAGELAAMYAAFAERSG